MRLLIITCFALITISTVSAQEIDQISVGAGYGLQTFYDVDSGEKTVIDGDQWDIAFTVFGFQDAGIFINESASLMGEEIELYDLGAGNFSTAVTEADLTNRIYNNDKSWQSGAFNEGRDPADFSDFGWGFYNPATMSVTGVKMFALKLRNGKMIKLQIEALNLTEYTFKYADLDGSNQKSVSFDKSGYSGKHLAYYSFDSEEMLDLEPDGWDLTYTRYSTYLEAGPDEIINYIVTGILTADGVQVAQADGIDPVSVSESDYTSDYSSSTDVIGFDWKDIDIATLQWSLVLDRVYFIKTDENKTYKLHFIDFEGSSTGITTFEKSEVMTTSTYDVFESNTTIGNAYPNPTHGTFSFDYETEKAGKIVVSIYQLDGKKLYSQVMDTHVGRNVISIDDFTVGGNYFLVLDNGERVYSQQLIIK